MFGHRHDRLPRRSFLQLGHDRRRPRPGFPTGCWPPRARPPRPRQGEKTSLVIFEQGGGVADGTPSTPSPRPSPSTGARSRRSTPSCRASGSPNFWRRRPRSPTSSPSSAACTSRRPGIGNSHPKGSRYIFSGEAPGGPVDYARHRQYPRPSGGLELPLSAALHPGSRQQRAGRRVEVGVLALGPVGVQDRRGLDLSASPTGGSRTST